MERKHLLKFVQKDVIHAPTQVAQKSLYRERDPEANVARY